MCLHNYMVKCDWKLNAQEMKSILLLDIIAALMYLMVKLFLLMADSWPCEMDIRGWETAGGSNLGQTVHKCLLHHVIGLLFCGLGPIGLLIWAGGSGGYLNLLSTPTSHCVTSDLSKLEINLLKIHQMQLADSCMLVH